MGTDYGEIEKSLLMFIGKFVRIKKKVGMICCNRADLLSKRM